MFWNGIRVPGNDPVIVPNFNDGIVDIEISETRPLYISADLYDTNSLCFAADFIRRSWGYRPQFDGENAGANGWYNFHLHIDVQKNVAEITFVPVETGDLDDEEEYRITLSSRESWEFAGKVLAEYARTIVKEMK